MMDDQSFPQENPSPSAAPSGAAPLKSDASGRLSVLQRATKADVRLEPFPHIVLPDALPAHLYERLARDFPSPARLGKDQARNNARWDYPASKVRGDYDLPQVWRDFIAYHASQSFFDEIAELFFDGVHALYPRHFPTRESLKGMRAGLRGADDFATADVLMDAMISGNTPVATAGSVRTTHVDAGSKLFSGLFYMRPEGYDAVGGDLTVSRFKPAYATLEKKLALFEDAYVDERHVDHVETVRYEKNVLVLFINSLESLHGVTVRQPSDKSRLFVNLVGEIDPPLYKTQRPGRPARYLPANYVSHRFRGGSLWGRLGRMLQNSLGGGRA